MKDWYAINSMIVGLIFNTIDPSLRSSLSYMDCAKTLWEDLMERFSIRNDMRIHQLKIDIVNWKQSGQSATSYYEKLKTMWEELGGYTKYLACTCSGCTCGAITELAQEREKEKTHQFLMGLDDGMFGTARLNILCMTPLPNVNRVYSMMLTEERHRNMIRLKDERPDVVGFVAHTGSHSRPPSKEKGKTSICSHCGKSGCVFGRGRGARVRPMP